MTLKRISVVCAATTLLVFLPTCPAPAELIEIQFEGLDLVYDGTDMYDVNDATNKLGGNFSPSEADELTKVAFLVDGNLVGELKQDLHEIFADVLIRDIPQPRATGDAVTSSGNGNDFGFDLFGFDLLTSTDWGLALNIDKFQMFFAGPDIAFAATGLATSIRGEQNLPFEIEVDESDRITIIAYSTDVDVTSLGGYVTRLEASDADGSVRGTGTIVPEPSSFVLVGIAIAGLLGFGWKKRRAAAAR